MILYDKTKGSANSVKALTSLSMQPFMLMSNRPGLKTFKDLTDQDRIAVPAVKTSMNAMFLSMAAEKYLGKDKVGFVDALQVAYSHPDAVISLTSGQSSITAHMATLPFSTQEAMDPKIHRVMNTYDLTDGPASIMATYATESFYKKNPRLMKVVYAALKEASEFIEKNKSEAAAIYIKADKSKLSQATVEGILNDPDNSFGVIPQKTMFFADWLNKYGLIKNKPTSWKDLFFDISHEMPGT
jgi:NitT/TauT family transport system substrate-binding protein